VLPRDPRMAAGLIAIGVYGLAVLVRYSRQITTA
jgi:tetrahydromethanopterin S-methyltransferase subunit F